MPCGQDTSFWGEMACGARSGLKLLLASGFLTMLLGRNGLWSPFGIENRTLHSSGIFSFEGRNGLWSPFGIETIWINVTAKAKTNGEMACGARSGLKPVINHR